VAYGAKDITVLKGLEPVRERPGMYIGSTGLSGLHHLVYEVVDNAVDEAMAGHATRIVVTLLADGGCRVDDNGRGIPVDNHPDYKNKSAAEVVRLVASGLVKAYPPGGANFVNADDVADGLILAMRAGRQRTRYILGGENLTHRDFLSQIAEECGQSAPLLPLPDWAARTLGRAGDVLGALSSARLGWVNTPFLRQLFEPTYVSSGLAQRTLGYRPRPVRHGIRDALRWYQEQGLLPRDRPLTPRGVLVRS